jgi:short-subunit dehydrogenase
MRFWEKKFALITGGSAGLGLAIAREFARQGALPIMLARNESHLQNAQQALADENLKSDFIVADVTDEDQARKAIEKIIERYGSLDVLVNNVGKSIRADFEKTTTAQYRDLMEVNLMTAINCTMAALPHITETSGHIVNIGSLSSKTAWPFVGPYTTSKFALAGFSHQLRLESAANVHVMLVCPGPIKRQDAGERYKHQAESLPAEARKPGAGVSFRGIDPDELAKKIVRGCQKRKLEILVPKKTRLMLVLGTISPRLGDWLIKRLNTGKK